MGKANLLPNSGAISVDGFRGESGWEDLRLLLLLWVMFDSGRDLGSLGGVWILERLSATEVRFPIDAMLSP